MYIYIDVLILYYIMLCYLFMMRWTYPSINNVLTKIITNDLRVVSWAVTEGAKPSQKIGCKDVREDQQMGFDIPRPSFIWHVMGI